MKILFLHGWQSAPGGLKPTYLKDHGHEVLNPALPEDDFDAAVRIAQAEYDLGHPDVVVGSSRGGAVAMNIHSGGTPLVLLCPAWKKWGTATKVKPSTIILHSKADDVVPFSDSHELVRNSGLPSESLIDVGREHRLADVESLEKMLGTVEWKAVREAMERRAALEAIAWIDETRKAFGRETRAPVHEAGVPRRFGVGVLLIITAMYAVLFTMLRALHVPPFGFLMVALFFTVVGLGQMLLFKGQRPRRASMIAGACFCAGLSVVDWMMLHNPVKPIRLPFSPFDPVEGIIVGAIYGYLAGTLIAGVFLLIDKRALASQARRLR